MKFFNCSVLGLVGIVLLFAGCTHSTQRSGDGNIEVHHAWVRAVPSNARTSAAYMRLYNHGKKDDRLVAADSPMAEVVELHNVFKEGDMMAMRPVKNILVPAHGSAALKPGSYHIMLINLKNSPKPGKKVNLTLTFEKAGKMDMMVPVQERPMKMMDHDKMGHGKVQHDKMEKDHMDHGGVHGGEK
ncbi:MAG: copper chaperone PCu(A)C [SAR324 cluster bacterium]|nr:copper chaperone PCu(A)C [SAR324 cluster bacterium]